MPHRPLSLTIGSPTHTTRAPFDVARRMKSSTRSPYACGQSNVPTGVSSRPAAFRSDWLSFSPSMTTIRSGWKLSTISDIATGQSK